MLPPLSAYHLILRANYLYFFGFSFSFLDLFTFCKTCLDLKTYVVLLGHDSCLSYSPLNWLKTYACRGFFSTCNHLILQCHSRILSFIGWNFHGAISQKIPFLDCVSRQLHLMDWHHWHPLKIKWELHFPIFCPYHKRYCIILCKMQRLVYFML